MTVPILQLEAVTVSYSERARQENEAGIFAINLSLAPGESLGIAGATGAGKSTLARAACALEPLDSGRVLIDGNCIAAATKNDRPDAGELRRLRSRFQILFQDPGTSLSPRMTVGSIIAEGAIAHGLWSKVNVEENIAKVLAEMNLSPTLAARFPNELSGGERRRVALARVNAVRPDLLILDEPTAGLDHENLADVSQLIRTLHEEGGTALLVISHDLTVLRDLSSRIAVMRGGKILEIRPTEELFDDPESSYAQALIAAAGGDVAWVEHEPKNS